MALNYSSLGKRIRYFRKKRGLSQMALAEEIDCATTFISYIENGQKRMSLNTLVAIANVLQVSADELLADSLDYNFRVTNHEFSDLMAELGLKAPEGMTDEQLGTLVTSVNPVRLKNNPVGLDEDAIRVLYKQIFR